MAPLLENSFDYSSSCNKFAITEFKPRVGAWASVNSWSLTSRIVDDDGDEESSSQQQQQEQQERRRQNRRRRVRFASNPEIRDYVHRKEFTTEEKRACWFRRSEYETMRTDNAATLDKLINHQPLDQQNESIVGLEDHTLAMDHYRCHQIIRCAILAVLEEQDDQRRYDGYINEHVLAARYMCCTREARDRALSLGHFQSLME